MYRKAQLVAAVLALAVQHHHVARGMPKIESGADAKGSAPLPHAKVDQLAVDTGNGTELAVQDRPPRFGFPTTYTTDVQGYSQTGGVVPGVYGPVKLDIGGLLLGTIVGLGAFFILPKLLHVAGPYGPYKRSEDEADTGASISDIFTRVQDSLNAYNLDSTACLQRAVCYSIQAVNDRSGNSTATDNLVDNIAKNDLTKSLLDGTDWKRAIDVGESGGNCGEEFPKCPVTLDGVASAIAKYLVS